VRRIAAPGPAAPSRVNLTLMAELKIDRSPFGLTWNRCRAPRGADDRHLDHPLRPLAGVLPLPTRSGERSVLENEG